MKNVERYGGDEEDNRIENVPTGQIEALVGGVNWNNVDYGQINYADQVLIPPGSSFKPFEFNIYQSPGDERRRWDQLCMIHSVGIVDPTTGAGYPCTDKNSPKVDPNANCLWDYDFLFPGPLTLRYAIGGFEEARL